MNQENLITPATLDLFESYFHKKLSDAQMSEVQSRLKSDEAFGKLYQSYLTSREVINDKIASGLRQDLKQWAADQSNQKIKSKVIHLGLWKKLAAACVLGLISLTVFQSNSNDRFIDDQIEKNFAVNYTRGDEVDVARIMIEWGRTKDENKAVNELTQIAPESSEYKKAQSALGYLSIKKGDFQNTLNHLEKANKLNQELRIYTGLLCKMKSNQIDQDFFKDLNQLLEDPKSDYYTHALDIKDKVNSFWWKLLR